MDEEVERGAVAGLPLPPRVLPEPVKVQPGAPLRPEAPELSSQVGWVQSITWTQTQWKQEGRGGRLLMMTSFLDFFPFFF